MKKEKPKLIRIWFDVDLRVKVPSVRTAKQNILREIKKRLKPMHAVVRWMGTDWEDD